MSSNISEELASMAENDINVTPAHDSPKNILNILDNDCLQMILMKLNYLRDFFRAAEVCTRFQENAKACFPFKKVVFTYVRHWYTYIYERKMNRLLLKDANSFLSIFGQKIETIKCNLQDLPEINDYQMILDENFNSISKYCGKTLNELKIYGDMTVEFQRPFEALEKLYVVKTTFKYFDSKFIFPELKFLCLNHCKSHLNWLANKFPKLQYVNLYEESLTEDMFIEFQNQNSQIKSLIFNISYWRSPLTYKDIENRLPNIVNLYLNLQGYNPEINSIGNLRHLKKFHLNINLNDFFLSREIQLLFSCMVENEQPIEELSINYADMELGKIIQCLKTIKRFHIRHTEEHVVVDIARNLPSLECLKVYKEISLRGATEILKHCEKLTELEIANDLKIDLNEYNSIVALATERRVKCTIFYENKNSLYYVPNVAREIVKEIEEKKNKWVHLTGTVCIRQHFVRLGKSAGMWPIF